MLELIKKQPHFDPIFYEKALPPLHELVKDEVYQGFVMVKYQEQKKRALKEKERALRVERQLVLEQQEKEEALRRAEEERLEKEEALRRAEEERLEKEEALRRASEERKKNERLLALLAQSGISLD